MDASLEALVAGVGDKQAVYAADLSAAQLAPAITEAPAREPERTPEEKAIDGVAWHVFNTLRGAHDNVPTKVETQTIDGESVEVPTEWATFEEVRAIVAQGGF